VSDIDTVVVDSLKALDPEWPIREADIGGCLICAKSRLVQRNRLREQMAGLLTRSLGKINQGSVEKCQVVHTLEKKVHLWS
jgi:hypothetical protein